MKDYSIQSGQAIDDVEAKPQPAPTQGTFANLQLVCIVPGLYNPRKVFEPVALAKLAASIKAQGVNQPILVRPLPASRVADTSRAVTHEIIAGERRYRASVLAGVPTIPVMIKPMTDAQALEFKLIENLQRENLNAMEEAEGFAHFVKATGTPKEDVGAKVGRSRTHVYSRLKLLDLCPAGKEALRTGQIDPSVAERIARVPDTALQEKALKEATRVDYQDKPVHSSRTFAKWMQENLMLNLSGAIFKMTDASLLPDAGSCKTCHKRTGHAPDLFSDVKGADVCTDPPCFHKKEEAHQAQLISQAQASGQTVITGREAKALMPNSYSGVEGYLRLDNASDSPTDQPLRKLIGKHLASSDVQPTLIVNPHKANDLIAVLPADIVPDLLKAAGHKTQAASLRKDARRDQEIDERSAAAKLEIKYEQGWRDMVVQRTWKALQDNPMDARLSSDLKRMIAQRYLQMMSSVQALALCKLLNLGKIAPTQAVRDYLATHPDVDSILLLMVMQDDCTYNSYRPDSDTAKPLLQIAKDIGISIDAIKSEAKQKFMPAPQIDAAEPSPKRPAALRKNQLNPAAKKPKPAKPARAKMTAQEAQLGIAEAMQKDEAASPQKGASAVVVGSKVRVTSEKDDIGPIAGSYAGKEGVVTHILTHGGRQNCDIKFKRGAAVFAIEQLEVAV